MSLGIQQELGSLRKLVDPQEQLITMAGGVRLFLNFVTAVAIVGILAGGMYIFSDAT